MHANRYRKEFVIFYFTCFITTCVWLFFNKLLLSQLAPVFFLNKLDLTRNFLMLTGMQQAIIVHNNFRIAADLVYILAPALLLFCCLKNCTVQSWMALFISLYNLAYAMIISSMSTLSIEGYIGWIMIPLLFVTRSPLSFQYLTEAMRYFFILVFVSAAAWKFRSGGFFNLEQMSAILLRQHTSYLVSEPFNWFSQVIYFLVTHPAVSWSLYAIATLAELIFAVGFFTKRFDSLLVVIFVLFLVFNYFFMRINYMSWVVFMGCFWFARRLHVAHLPDEKREASHQFYTISN